MALTRKEIEQRKISIQNENVILQRVKRMLQWSLVFCSVCVLLLLTMLNGSDHGTLRAVVLVLAIFFGAFSVFAGLSYRNGRKHLLKKINDLDAKK